MRLLLTTATLALVLAAAAPARLFDEATIVPSGLGPLKIGMTETEVEKAIGKNVRQFKNAGVGRVCGSARLDGRNFMIFTNDVLRRVSVAGRQYDVKESGLGVGDAQSAIRDFYADRAKRTKHVYDPGGFYYSVEFGARKKIRFETDGDRITQIHSGRTPEVDYVEGCA